MKRDTQRHDGRDDEYSITSRPTKPCLTRIGTERHWVNELPEQSQGQRETTRERLHVYFVPTLFT